MDYRELLKKYINYTTRLINPNVKELFTKAEADELDVIWHELNTDYKINREGLEYYQVGKVERKE